MPTFTPVNSLEKELRTLLKDRNTPLWNFYTPLWQHELKHDGCEHCVRRVVRALR